MFLARRRIWAGHETKWDQDTSIQNADICQPKTLDGETVEFSLCKHWGCCWILTSDNILSLWKNWPAGGSRNRKLALCGLMWVLYAIGVGSRESSVLGLATCECFIEAPLSSSKLILPGTFIRTPHEVHNHHWLVSGLLKALWWTGNQGNAFVFCFCVVLYLLWCLINDVWNEVVM